MRPIKLFAGALAVIALTAALSGCGATPGPGGSGATAEASVPPVAVGDVDPSDCREIFDAPADGHGPSLAVVVDNSRSANKIALSADEIALVEATARARGTVTILGVNGAKAAPVIVAKDATLYPAGLRAGTKREARVIAMAPACVESVASTAAPTAAGSDVLTAWQDAAALVAGRKDATILIRTDGLANSGVLDLNQVAGDAEAKQVVAAIEKADQLPHTQAATIVSGLAATAGQRVDAKQRDWLTGLYRTLCEATGATSCTIGEYSGAADSVVHATAPEDAAVTLGESPTIVIDEVAQTCTVDLPESVSFAPDSYRPKDTAAKTLAPVVAALRANPGATVTVIGHTASASDDKEALKRFGELRAASIAELLVGAGIERSRITVIGVGDTQPKVEDVVGGRLVEPQAQANRRVVLQVEGGAC